jgi:hypothetical protein
MRPSSGQPTDLYQTAGWPGVAEECLAGRVDEQQVTKADGMRVVADRFAQFGQPNLLALHVLTVHRTTLRGSPVDVRWRKSA